MSLNDGIIGTLRTYDRRELELAHSSNAEVSTFWVRMTAPNEEKKTIASLTVLDAKVLISLLEKGIEAAERKD